MARVGLLHPGAMGAAVGGQLVAAGHEVLWASRDRSPSTAQRAADAGLVDAVDLAALVRRSELIISICPPAGAVAVAASVAGFEGPFLDANAVSPATAQAIAGATNAPYTDGGIIGPPPADGATARLYLSGAHAEDFAELFTGTRVDARVLDEGGPYAASALKMTFAAWSKGSAALLLACSEAAGRLGIGEALAAEWAISRPGMAARVAMAGADAADKGWRWAPEMEEIADTFAAVGLPTGFHTGAAELYRQPPTA